MSVSLSSKKPTMEEFQAEKENKTHHKAKSVVWDCGSSLYDSFELKSFERQLDSAISSRTLSMPRLTYHQPPPLPLPPPQPISKKSSKFSRSFQKLLRSIFRPKQQTSKQGSQNGFYDVYDRSFPLSTIPEVPERESGGGDYGGGGLSPDIKSLVIRRSASERFPATSIGISCA